QEITNKYYKAITESTYREELEEKYGRQLFELASNSLKAFDPKVKELLQKENKLDSEYSKLLASAEIEFDGKKLNLSVRALLPAYRPHDETRCSGSCPGIHGRKP